MSFRELRAYVQRLEETGHRVGKYVVELNSKVSFPFVHLIMALVAIPFALASPRSGGRAVGIGVAIMISVGYWVVHYMALAFAKADLLPALPRRLDRQHRVRGPGYRAVPPRPDLAALAQLPQRLLEALLLLAVGRPVAAPQRLLALLPRLPRALAEQPQPGVGGGAAPAPPAPPARPPPRAATRLRAPARRRCGRAPAPAWAPSRSDCRRPRSRAGARAAPPARWPTDTAAGRRSATGRWGWRASSREARASPAGSRGRAAGR